MSFRPLAAALVCAGLSSCAPAAYLAQAARGQAELLSAARPLEAALQNPTLPQDTRRKLTLAAQARTFATSLGLPDSSAFRTYADLGRPFVVWNVFSAPALNTQLQTSCFPIAGCVGYRGYFRQTDALAYAEQRRALGEDVYVGGVKAYSTLGHLPDPLTSAMLSYPDSVLIRTVLHELAHASLYVAGDTTFNESYAVTVENEGMRRYLAQFGTPELREEDAQLEARAAAFETLVLEAQRDLAQLYALPLPDTERLSRKAERLTRLGESLSVLNANWRGYSPLKTDWNNASLGAIAAYAELVPDFEALLARQGGDLNAFMRAARACTALEQQARRTCLKGP